MTLCKVFTLLTIISNIIISLVESEKIFVSKWSIVGMMYFENSEVEL